MRSLYFLLLVAFALAKRPLVRNVKNKNEMDRIMAHHKLTGLPVIIDYYSDSCGPCRMIAPIYQRMAKEYEGRAVFLKVNTQVAYDISQGIRSLPTFRFYMGGRKKNEFSGAGEGQLRQIVNELSRDARKRKSHIHEVKGTSGLKSLLQNSASLPVLLSYTSKTSEDCKKVWPEVKKMALQAFGRAIFLKLDVDAEQNKGMAEQAGVTETPVFHFYQAKQKQEQAVTGPDHLAVKKILQELISKKPADESASSNSTPQKCPDVAPQPKHPEPKRPQTRSAYRRKTSKPEKVVILGAGPAGLSAAVYAARAGLKPLLIAPDFGGQLMFTKDVENYPAVFAETGPKLLDAMRAQAERFDTAFEAVVATKVDLSKRPFQITINRTEDNHINTHTLIISTGADARWLGVEGEEAFRAKGISTCATCDGFLYNGKPVVVIGGGDSAMEEALYLARICSNVTIIHRKNSFRASHILQQRVLKHPKIKVQWQSTISKFEGNADGLTQVVVSVQREGTEASELKMPVHAAFIAIGHNPNTGLFANQLDMNKDGYLNLPTKSTATSVPGVFACGDVADNVYRQAVTSAGTGAMAALDVEKFLNENEIDDSQYVDSIDFSRWSIKELKATMVELGISTRGCVEKKDFIERLNKPQSQQSQK